MLRGCGRLDFSALVKCGGHTVWGRMDEMMQSAEVPWADEEEEEEEDEEEEEEEEDEEEDEEWLFLQWENCKRC